MSDDYLQLQPGPFQPTSVQGGLARLVRIWEYLRDHNQGGYGSGVLMNMKHGPHGSSTKTSCSPFTATCIYLAMDPREVDTSKPWSLEGPYDPRFDGGSVLGPRFYALHNSYGAKEFKTKKGAWQKDFKEDYVDKVPGFLDHWKWYDHSAGSIVLHNLGTPVDDKQMRRGDMVGIDWMNKGGHAVFCWNVHLNAQGEVDCFQYVSANGSHSGGPGISVGHNPLDKRYLELKDGTYKKVKDMFSGIVDDPRAYPEYVSAPYHWYALRHIKKKDIDKTTFGVPASQVRIIDYTDEWKGYKLGVDVVHCARLHGVEAPEPWLRADGGTGDTANPAPKKADPVARVDSRPVEVQGPPSGGSSSGAASSGGSKASSSAGSSGGSPSASTPAPATSSKPPDKPPPAKVQDHQIEVETWLQILFKANFIDADPGQPDAVNDPQSQAALKQFQKKFMSGAKVPHPGHADPTTRKHLARYAGWALGMPAVAAGLEVLHEHGVLDKGPGTDWSRLDDATLAAVKEFQKKKGLSVDGIPGPQTMGALNAAIVELGSADQMSPAPASQPQSSGSTSSGGTSSGAQPAAASGGQKAALSAVYFVSNYGPPGGNAVIAVKATGAEGVSLEVALYKGGSALAGATGTLTIQGAKGRLAIEIPADLPGGTQLEARVSGGGLSGKTSVLFTVETASADADWRPYIGKDAVPDEVLEAIRQNRARYPTVNLPLVTKGKYKGTNHFDYKPGPDHQQWARDYFKQKLQGAKSPAVVKAYLHMLENEGFPSSLQTYDNQIVTWGTGLGAKGDGVHAFEHLSKDAAMLKRLDGLGLNYFDGDYHVVDLVQKKVISSAKGKKGDDGRHVVALEAWKRQKDLLCAIIGLSEDPETRAPVAESQYAVYLSNSAQWRGQDKVWSMALFFMIAHMYQWLPAIAKYGFDVEKEFAAIGGGTPSAQTDTKMAPRIANAFIRQARKWGDKNGKNPSFYDDVHTRTKTHLYAQFRKDAKGEGFDPGELVYESDVA